MKTKYLFTTFILLVFSTFLFAGCISNYQKKDFDNLMVSMGKKDWRTIELSKQMYNDTAFMEIYNHNKFYYDDVISFLKTEKFEDTLKYSPVSITECIWAMQNLSLKQYVCFCDTIFLLFNSEKLQMTNCMKRYHPILGEDISLEKITKMLMLLICLAE